MRPRAAIERSGGGGRRGGDGFVGTRGQDFAVIRVILGCPRAADGHRSEGGSSAAAYGLREGRTVGWGLAADCQWYSHVG